MAEWRFRRSAFPRRKRRIAKGKCHALSSAGEAAKRLGTTEDSLFAALRPDESILASAASMVRILSCFALAEKIAPARN
jgi:hypothetical protein